MIGRESWRHDAACIGLDSESFFPEDQSSTYAKKVCVACTVKDPCLSWALTKGERGIWGGTTDRERKRMRTRLGIKAVPMEVHGTEAGARAHHRRGEPVCAECSAGVARQRRLRKEAAQWVSQ